MCSQLNLVDRPSLEDVRASIGKKREKATNHTVKTTPSHSVRSLIEGLQLVPPRTTTSCQKMMVLQDAHSFI